MAGDEDKKVKKKKVKKADKEKKVEEAPPPEPEAAPAPAEEAPAPVEGDAAPAADEAVVPTEGPDGDVIAEPPPAPKKKPKFFIHWNRKKPRFYDYNFDYGESYYSPVVNYLDSKNLDCFSSIKSYRPSIYGVHSSRILSTITYNSKGSRSEIPRRMGFAERGITYSLIRKSQPDIKTQNILHDVRCSIRGFETFQRQYAHDMNRKYI